MSTIFARWFDVMAGVWLLVASAYALDDDAAKTLVALGVGVLMGLGSISDQIRQLRDVPPVVVNINHPSTAVLSEVDDCVRLADRARRAGR